MAAPATPVVTVATWPAFALVTVRVEIAGDAATVDVYRDSPSGARSYVRGAVAADTAGLFTIGVSDLEVPFGVPVSYTAVARNNDGESVSAAVQATLDVTVDYLNDLDDLRNVGPVTVESFDELTYDAPQSVLRVLSRRTPVVTSDIRWTPSAMLVLVTLTDEERRKVRDAFGGGGPVLFRTPPARGVGNMFVAATSVVEKRVSRLADHPERRFAIQVVQVDRPDASLFVPAVVTFADIDTAFATFADLDGARVDLASMLFSFDGIPTPADYSPEPDWPARDA